MSNYDFRSLSPIDFEVLVRDLLQEELSLTLESFKPGKDLGIDFRFTTNNENTVVVQCKHYVESGFDALHYVLEILGDALNILSCFFILSTLYG